MNKFQEKYSLEERMNYNLRANKTHPKRVHTIVQPVDKTVPVLKNNKKSDQEWYNMAIPMNDYTVGNVHAYLRRLFKQHHPDVLTSWDSLHMFVQDPETGDFVIPKTSDLWTTVQNEYQDKDGFVYVYYGKQVTFG